MPNVYATVEDVALVWDGTIKDSDEPRVQQLLTYAHALLRTKVSGLDSKVVDDTLDPDLLQMIIIDAVIRVLNNPKGILGGGTGNTNFYYSQSGAQKFGGLSISAEDLAVLGVGSRATTVRSYRLASPFATVREESWRHQC